MKNNIQHKILLPLPYIEILCSYVETEVKEKIANYLLFSHRIHILTCYIYVVFTTRKCTFPSCEGAVCVCDDDYTSAVHVYNTTCEKVYMDVLHKYKIHNFVHLL